MTGRAVIALGIGQCINWGALYYAFAVLVVPLQRELQVDTWVVAGAFSVALATSAAVAPAVGRWSDLGRGPLVMQAGGAAAAGLLLVWPLTSGVAALYLVWAGLGLCMAATLYEPAFGIVARAYDDPVVRLRALAALTLFGGLASTVFLPATALLVTAAGWRGAAVGLAAALALSTALTRFLVSRGLAPASRIAVMSTASRTAFPKARSFMFAAVAAIFTLGTLASGAFATNLVPALGERGVAPATAALLGGLMGAMQLPGRALLMHGRFAASPTRLLTGSLALHAAGLALVATGPATSIVAAGAMTFALGAGVNTLVRPHLVHTLFGDSSGFFNGRVARQQQLARAAGPVLVAWLAGRFSYAAVFAVIAAAFAIAAVFARGGLMEKQILPASCCGGPAPQDAGACCARDAEVKTAGGTGCGCASVPAVPVRRKAGCCAEIDLPLARPGR